MSQYSDDMRKKFAKEYVKEGQRAWFFQLTGQMMEARRKKVFLQVAKKVEENRDTKKPWEMFRFTVERDEENEYDPFAVKLHLLILKQNEWKKVQIGFVMKNDRKLGGEVLHNKAVFNFLKEDQVVKVTYPGTDKIPELTEYDVRMVHCYYDSQKNFASAHFAIITPFEVDSVPRGVKHFENYGISGGGEVDRVKKETVRVEAPPAAVSNEFPDAQMIDKLITLNKEFQRFFSYEDSGGENSPFFLLQCIQPQVFGMDEIDFQAAWDNEYDQDWHPAENTIALERIRDEYGAIMAKNYYRLTGIFEGPFTESHVSKVIRAATEMLAPLKRFQANA